VERWKIGVVCLLLLIFTLPIVPTGIHRGTRISTVEHGSDNQKSHYVRNEIIVRFEEEPSAEQWAAWGRAMDIEAKPHKLPQTYLVTSSTQDTPALLRYFRKQQIKYAEPHWIYETQLSTVTPNDEFYARYQWNVEAVHAPEAWQMSRGSRAVQVAVVDTGVDLTHPDLRGKLVRGTNVVDGRKSAADDNGHGTHVAGIIAARTNNLVGIAGLTWRNAVMPIKAMGADGSGTTFAVADGIIEAVDRGARVINLSLGNYATSAFLRDAVLYAERHQVVLVAAAGNDDSGQSSYPAAYPEVLAVAATTRAGAVAGFSNYGPYVDVAAPGDGIASTYKGGQYAMLSGTSMATPHVAALAALVCGVNPRLTAAQVRAVITSTATDIGPAGRDDHSGYGEIDVQRALEKAKTWARPAPTVTPVPSTQVSPTPATGEQISILQWLIDWYTRRK
jgi:subtilisin family serine protease